MSQHVTIGTTGTIVNSVLSGLRCKVAAISQRTGSLTITLITGIGAYKPGDSVVIKPYEFEADKKFN